MLCYKQLWIVEQAFRTAKHLLATRPIFHRLDETIRGHVFCSFLALVLKKALALHWNCRGDRRHPNRRTVSPQLVAQAPGRRSSPISKLLTETEIDHEGKRFVVRSAPRPAASLALRAAGVALPPTVRQVAD